MRVVGPMQGIDALPLTWLDYAAFGAFFSQREYVGDR